MDTLIRSTNMWGFPELVRELGGDPERLCARFHLTPGVERREDAFVPFESVVRLVEASAEELTCPDFGLRLARWQGLDILGPVAVMARNADTVLEGMSAIARYLYVHCPALRLSPADAPGPGQLRFTYTMDLPPSLPAAQSYELSLANAALMIAFLAGPGGAPSAVYFQHDQQGEAAAYRAALGAPVVFGHPWCGFDLPAELLERRIDRADPQTKRIAARYLDSEFLAPDAPLSERVAQLARRMLPTGQCGVDPIAAHLGLHPRTLQRRLTVEGLTCQDVIDRVRREQAARYLAEPTFPFAQVAGLLGYAEQSVLNRSCRRWFGRTPQQYRNEASTHRP